MTNTVRIDGDLASSSKSKAACAWTDAGAQVLALHGINEDGRCTCGDRHCKSPGKHPIAAEFPRGQHSATRSKTKIKRVLKSYPDANLGVVLPDDIVVLDVDGPTGKDTYERLDLPKTATVQTGRGTHRYFRTREPLPEKRQRLDGIDIKDCRSGYIVAPPSKHQSGKHYRIRTVSTSKIALLPRSFIDGLRPKQSATVNLDQSGVVTKGARNSTLASYAGYLSTKAFMEGGLSRSLARSTSRYAAHL